MTDSTLRADIEAAFSAREEDTAYALALGRLTIAWADAEADLYRVLLKYTKVDDAIGRAIFSGNRSSVMITHIRTIAHNTNMDNARLNDLEFVFAQMGAINTMRDALVHFSSESYSYPPSNPKQRVITNERRVSRYGKHYEHIVDAETINTMTWDLYAISNHLNAHWGPRDGSFQAWEENPGEPTTWLYKSPQPKGR